MPLTSVPGTGYRLQPGGDPRKPPTGSPLNPYPVPKEDGTIGDQEDQLRNPSPIDIKTAPNPFQTEAYGDAKTFADSLADRSNASITNAMQRTRDVGAGAQADVAAQAGRRGGAPGSGLAGVLGERAASENTRQVAKTNADLTDVALGRENAARALEMGGATDIARDQTDMFGKQSDLYLGGRRADLDRASYYSHERDARFDRAARIAELALRTNGATGVPGGVYNNALPGGFSVGSGGRGGVAQTNMGTRPGTYSDVPGSAFSGGA